jgi:hypothetical protein
MPLHEYPSAKLRRHLPSHCFAGRAVVGGNSGQAQLSARRALAQQGASCVAPQDDRHPAPNVLVTPIPDTGDGRQFPPGLSMRERCSS